MQKSIIADQWRGKIVEFRGAEARRHAALSCFSPANIELFIATNSPDDSLLLSWLHSCRFTSIFFSIIYSANAWIHAIAIYANTSHGTYPTILDIIIII